MVFADRTDAGNKLSRELVEKRYERPLVLALPRGGVPVAYEVARALACPLDTLVVRKVGAPLNPEFAVGALAPHGIVLIDDEALSSAHISRAAVEGVIGKERAELERRTSAYRSGTFAAGYIPGTIIIIDDGVATGLTARAACMAARKKYPKARIVFAAPVCIADSAATLAREADEVVCLTNPTDLYAVGQAYELFPQVSDAEVMQYLSGDPPILATR